MPHFSRVFCARSGDFDFALEASVVRNASWRHPEDPQFYQRVEGSRVALVTPPAHITNVTILFPPLRDTIPLMDLKRLITQVAYKIEAKPEGGFIARATDPSVPPLEAPTREELQQKIQQNILAAISAELPGLKVPPGAKHLEMSFHIEHNPGGGYSIHSSDPNTSVIQTTNQEDLETQFLEKVLGFAGKNLAPEMVKKLAAQVGSANVKVVVNRSVTFQTNSDGKGITFGTPKGSSLQSATTQTPQLTDPSAGPNQLAGIIANNPITPEPSNAGKIFGVLIMLLILAGLMYLFLQSR